MRWIGHQRYVLLATALCVFAFARLAFAAGANACKLEMQTAGHYVWDIIGQEWDWVDDGPTSFACVNNNCTGTCPSSPAVQYFNDTDYNGDEIADEQWLHSCTCSTIDEPAGAMGAWCATLGRKYKYGGTGAESYSVDCVEYGSCLSCTNKWSYPDPPAGGHRSYWCECP